MATPISKKVQLDRKSSFLDNISTRVSENKKRKETTKGSDKTKEKLTKPAGMFYACKLCAFSKACLVVVLRMLYVYNSECLKYMYVVYVTVIETFMYAHISLTAGKRTKSAAGGSTGSKNPSVSVGLIFFPIALIHFEPPKQDNLSTKDKTTN